MKLSNFPIHFEEIRRALMLMGIILMPFISKGGEKPAIHFFIIRDAEAALGTKQDKYKWLHQKELAMDHLGESASISWKTYVFYAGQGDDRYDGKKPTIDAHAKIAAMINDIGTKIGPDDAVVIQYSGHGAVKDSDQKWPSLMLTRENKERPRGFENVYMSVKEGIFDPLSQRNPRFLIVIADACSKIRTQVASAFISRSEPEYKVERLRELYTTSRGHYLVSSSSNNQAAWGDRENGGFFTNRLSKEIEKHQQMDHSVNWSMILDACTKHSVTQDMSENGRSLPAQNAHYSNFK